MGGTLSRATASDEVKGEGGQEGEGHESVQTFTVSDISEATSYVFDLKKLQKERTGGKNEKQYYILSRGLCLTKTTSTKGQGHFPGVCGLRQPSRLTSWQRQVIGSEEGLFFFF